MKKNILFIVLMMSASVFAKTQAEEALMRKLGIIQNVSAECFKKDITILKYISVIALNTEESISSTLTQFKSEAGSSCVDYDQKVDVYVNQNDEQLDSISKGLETCEQRDEQLKKDFNLLLDRGFDLTNMYVQMKALNPTQQNFCPEVREMLNVQLKANP